LNLAQAFNPLGSIAGVLIGTVFIFSGIELSAPQVLQLKARWAYESYLQAETLRVVTPYLVLGSLVIIWGILLLRTPFPEVDNTSENATGSSGERYSDLLAYPHFLLAVLTQFCYVGAQVGTWSYFIQYAQDYTSLPEKTAGFLLTGTLVGFAVGRFASSQLMRIFQPAKLMAAFALTNVVLVGIAVAWPGWIGMCSLFLTSFFMSLMFPTIFALGLRGMGENSKPASSLIVMAIIGGAVFTPLMGVVYQLSHSMAVAMIVPLVCYLFVALYAGWGCTLPPFVKATGRVHN
jgi:FHS family L-fucose permease-like MFS transporter